MLAKPPQPPKKASKRTTTPQPDVPAVVPVGPHAEPIEITPLGGVTAPREIRALGDAR